MNKVIKLIQVVQLFLDSVSLVTFRFTIFAVLKKKTRGRTQPAQPSSRINRPPINPPPSIINPPAPIINPPAGIGRPANNSAPAQAAATSSATSSGASLSQWLQLQILPNGPTSGQGVSASFSSFGQGQSVSASSSSSPGVAWSILQPTPAGPPGRMHNDPQSWFHGEMLPASGDVMCAWADTTCSSPEPFATKACHFSTRHRPKQVYACDSCTLKHQCSFNEVLDLHR